MSCSTAAEGKEIQRLTRVRYLDKVSGSNLSKSYECDDALGVQKSIHKAEYHNQLNPLGQKLEYGVILMNNYAYMHFFQDLSSQRLE